MPHRPPRIQHCTSLPFRFFGRKTELALLDESLQGGEASVVAFIGPGGQGKTAIVQHWLESLAMANKGLDAVFLWSFYRGKDPDLFLRELYAYAAGLAHPPDVAASYCVDQLLPMLRSERWVLVLDGAEVAQYDAGPWRGRFIHPEVSRLLEELAGAPLPGVVLITSRFALPELERRKHAHLLTLEGLDVPSARGLLRSLRVDGDDVDLDQAAAACGYHAKAVELLGTFLRKFSHGEAGRFRNLPKPDPLPGMSDEEQRVAWVLSAYHQALDPEAQDILALATAFREPPDETRLLQYLASPPVKKLLHETWGRSYAPFNERAADWLANQIEELIALRLLERVACTPGEAQGQDRVNVIDAHPLVRRGFEHVLGVAGRRQSAQARAGFLRGRPDRRRPATLEQAREEVELFYAHCDAGLWNEADGNFVVLDNPKHRLMAPALERDLLLRFFPGGDWRKPPLWHGFGRYRSLAICFELLGDFEDALEAYRDADAPLRGDALLALGRLQPLLSTAHVPHPWDTLWQAYRAHALCLAGRTTDALALARGLVPVDIYEWFHVFECLLRAGRLDALDLKSMLYRPPHAGEQRWSELARQRMRLDYLRVQNASRQEDLGAAYQDLLEAYDRGGMPFERALTRLSYARWLLAQNNVSGAEEVILVVRGLAERFRMRVIAADSAELMAAVRERAGQHLEAQAAQTEMLQLREKLGYCGPARP